MPTQRIEPPELSRAILIDYEGNVDKPPTLLGWLVDGKKFAAILEEEFRTCEDRYRAKDIFFAAHHDLAAKLIKKANDEDRVIIGWSEHDLHQMLKVLSKSDQTSLLGKYRNAIKTARPWHFHKHGKAAPTGALAYFNELLKFPVPERYGTGKVGSGLRLIRSQLREGRGYAELTPKAQASWVAIVKHNALDLRSMEYVLKSILKDQGDA